MLLIDSIFTYQQHVNIKKKDVQILHVKYVPIFFLPGILIFEMPALIKKSICLQKFNCIK